LLPVQAVFCLLCWAALRYLPLAGSHPIAVACVAHSVVAWAGGSLLSELGGLDSPAFYGLYTVPSLPIALPTPLRGRLALTAALVIPFVLAYFLPHPEYLQHPLLHVPALYVSSIIVAAVISGHWIYGLTRDRFLLAREIEDQRRLLAQHNAHLSQEVRQKSSQVQRLSARIETLHLDVRSDLARTLHDDLGQLIVGARMELSNIERLLSGDKPPEGDELSFLYEIVESLARSTKRIVGDLREEAAGELRDVAHSIESLVAPIRERSQMRVTTSVELDRALCPETREAIYRTVQEAMTNILKHAKATHAQVHVGASDDAEVMVVVSDDGVGFDTAATAEGWGLVGLRERAESLGGKLAIRSGARGSRIELRLPVGR
jgi:signal transduction histidine kinase